MAENKKPDELKKYESLFPVPPEIFQTAMPTPVPPMNYQSGFIADWIHNWKLARMERSSASEAAISQNQQQRLASDLAKIEEIITYTARLDLKFKQYKHQERMMNVEYEIREAERDKLRFENQEAYYNTKKIKFEYDEMVKDAKGESPQS